MINGEKWTGNNAIIYTKNTIKYISGHAKIQDIPSNSKNQAQEGSQQSNQGVLSTAPIYQKCEH